MLSVRAFVALGDLSADDVCVAARPRSPDRRRPAGRHRLHAPGPRRVRTTAAGPASTAPSSSPAVAPSATPCASCPRTRSWSRPPSSASSPSPPETITLAAADRWSGSERPAARGMSVGRAASASERRRDTPQPASAERSHPPVTPVAQRSPPSEPARVGSPGRSSTPPSRSGPAAWRDPQPCTCFVEPVRILDPAERRRPRRCARRSPSARGGCTPTPRPSWCWLCRAFEVGACCRRSRSRRRDSRM